MAEALRIPVTLSFHTDFDQDPSTDRVGWIRPLVSTWLRRIQDRTGRTFVPSQDSASKPRRQGYSGLRILSRGVDLALFSLAHRDESLRAQWGLLPSDLAVMHVGRIATEMNHALLFMPSTRFVNPRLVLGWGW